MAELFVASDLHLGHQNIIKYTERPYMSLQHMNTALIENWNARVHPDDTVWHIGDFCFKGSPYGGNGMHRGALEWEARLNGRIYHVRGNHDGNNNVKYVPDYAVLRYGGKNILLIHNPAILPVSTDIDFVVCGHVHNAWKMRIDRNTGLPVFNASVDVNDYTPVSMRNVIKQIMAYAKSQRRLKAKDAAADPAE